MNKNQKIVVKWLTNSESNFLDNLHELEGDFDLSETIPSEVSTAYGELSYVEKIEVVKKSASHLLKERVSQ